MWFLWKCRFRAISQHCTTEFPFSKHRMSEREREDKREVIIWCERSQSWSNSINGQTTVMPHSKCFWALKINYAAIIMIKITRDVKFNFGAKKTSSFRLSEWTMDWMINASQFHNQLDCMKLLYFRICQNGIHWFKIIGNRRKRHNLL